MTQPGSLWYRRGRVCVCELLLRQKWDKGKRGPLQVKRLGTRMINQKHQTHIKCNASRMRKNVAYFSFVWGHDATAKIILSRQRRVGVVFCSLRRKVIFLLSLSSRCLFGNKKQTNKTKKTNPHPEHWLRAQLVLIFGNHNWPHIKLLLWTAPLAFIWNSYQAKHLRAKYHCTAQYGISWTVQLHKHGILCSQLKTRPP